MSEIPLITLKLLILYTITTKRQLIHDRTASQVIRQQNYDFIVVGAGTAGCTIAKRLTENPNVMVLLLESGGPQLATYTDMPGLAFNITNSSPDVQYMYYSEPQLNAAQQYPGGRPFEPLGKVLGGSSTHNSMLFNRGNSRTYDEWALKYGAHGWTYKEVLPFFKRYENNTDTHIVAQNPGYHGVSGPVQITSVKKTPTLLKLLQKAYNEMGFQNIDINGARQYGTMIMQVFIDQNGIRSSAANAYIDPNPHPNNLHIVSRAQVLKILFNGLTAVGVDFVWDNQLNRVYAEREVILTAGVANTPKLLMLSGIGVTNHLQQMEIPVLLDLPVGDNYQNHPQVNINARIIKHAHFYEPPLLNYKQLSELYFEKKGRLSQNPFSGLYFNTSNYSKDWPNALVYTTLLNDRLIMSLNLVRIKSRGTVRLYDKNPYLQPRLDPQFLGHPQDFEDAVEGTAFLFYILETSSIAPYVNAPTFESIGCPVCPNKYRYQCIEGIRCYVRYNTQTTYHPCGSCRMGDLQRQDVVVDHQFRVKYVNQLRICDASVFPSIPNSNTNAPTFMAAEKCAQILKDYHNLG